MMYSINYYEILEINENASQEVIKAAYRALSFKYHPDTTNDTKEKAHNNMILINEAYSVLSDETKRREYDQKLNYERKKEFTSQTVKDDMNKESEMERNSCANNSESDFGEENVYQDNMQICNSFAGKVGRFFKSVGKGIVNEMQRNVRIRDNAYLNGMNMDEFSLVRKFKRSNGLERSGYAKAMAEKGLLRINDDGKYEPTFLLKKYW